MSDPIRLPKFARQLLHDRLRCTQCSGKIFEQDVTFAGVAKDKNGILKFTYEARCPHCERINTIADGIREFTIKNWWEEVGDWHQHALATKGPFDANPWKKGRMFAVVGPIPLLSVEVCLGYKGDVGPLLLYCYGSLVSNGHFAARLERNNRLRVLDGKTKENMPHERWWRLRKVPEGGSFVYEKRTWFRLTRQEIKDIIRDRVFTPIGPVHRNEKYEMVTKQERGIYEKPDSPKGGKRTRRPPRNPRSLDS